VSRGPRIVLLGKQGAGKGTQATRLGDRYGVAHVSTGDLLRASADKGTRAGLMAADYMNRGELVPDDTVLGVVEEQFAEGGSLEDGFVLDGFPRNLHQAQELEHLLDGHPLDVVINLDVPRDIVLDRIAGRRVCENCGANYHVNMPPKSDMSCDVCSGKVVQREDDTEEAVRRRLELYDEVTVPIIDFYRKLGKLVVVDGVGDGDDVFDRLVDVVDRSMHKSPQP
jgi:adenylate kinase